MKSNSKIRVFWAIVTIVPRLCETVPLWLDERWYRAFLLEWLKHYTRSDYASHSTLCRPCSMFSPKQNRSALLSSVCSLCCVFLVFSFNITTHAKTVLMYTFGFYWLLFLKLSEMFLGVSPKIAKVDNVLPSLSLFVCL